MLNVHKIVMLEFILVAIVKSVLLMLNILVLKLLIHSFQEGLINKIKLINIKNKYRTFNNQILLNLIYLKY
jgi:hypothetical protein